MFLHQMCPHPWLEEGVMSPGPVAHSSAGSGGVTSPRGLWEPESRKLQAI